MTSGVSSGEDDDAGNSARSAIGFNAPTDTPPGPFSFMNIGRLVLVIAPDGSGTITQLSGNTTDLCAAVA
jgi:hypothetical protein